MIEQHVGQTSAVDDCVVVAAVVVVDFAKEVVDCMNNRIRSNLTYYFFPMNANSNKSLY
jgi:hypothetical protein